MKREIKFRAWHINKKRYVPISEIHTTINNATIAGMRETWSGDEYLPHLITYEQFTGLKDKNGKEIYEGDILRDAGIVAWNDVEARWSCIDLVWNNNREWHDMLYLTTPLEIIGNIHEDPELLK